jgi:hypothetical protein
MLRKQFLIEQAHEDYLHSLSEATGESQGHIVRQAIELHAQHFSPASLPGLIEEKETTENKDKTNESES